MCPPAAASSSARRARSCPRTSARSGAAAGAVAVRRSGGSGSSSQLAAQVGDRLGEVPDRDRARRRREPPRARSRPGTGAARRRAAARPRQRRGRRRPGAAGRRARARRPRRCARARSRGSCCDAASSASAIGRSKPEPSLRSSAGARLTVIRRGGKLSSAAEIPERTRSRASWQARSARPTIAKPGMPSRTCASTSTRRGSRPTSACVTARASTLRRYERNRDAAAPSPWRLVPG